jgi:hypothetical protein
VIRRTIRVPPRGNTYGAYQQQAQQQTAVLNGSNFQASSNLLSAGSYGNVQQAASGHQQYGSAAAISGSYSTGYAGQSAVAAPSNYGAYAGAYGAQSGGYAAQQGFSGYSSQPVQPSAGIHQAFCFQV